jgi:hypothetical protein
LLTGISGRSAAVVGRAPAPSFHRRKFSSKSGYAKHLKLRRHDVEPLGDGEAPLQQGQAFSSMSTTVSMRCGRAGSAPRFVRHFLAAV